MIRDIVIAAIAVSAYVLLVLARPVGRCHRCWGKRVRRPKKGSKARPRKCRTCGASGLSCLPGATLIHRLFWLIFGDFILGRRKAKVAERQAARREAS